MFPFLSHLLPILLPCLFHPFPVRSDDFPPERGPVLRLHLPVVVRAPRHSGLPVHDFAPDDLLDLFLVLYLYHHFLERSVALLPDLEQPDHHLLPFPPRDQQQVLRLLVLQEPDVADLLVVSHTRIYQFLRLLLHIVSHYAETPLRRDQHTLPVELVLVAEPHVLPLGEGQETDRFRQLQGERFNEFEFVFGRVHGGFQEGRGDYLGEMVGTRGNRSA